MRSLIDCEKHSGSLETIYTQTIKMDSTGCIYKYLAYTHICIYSKCVCVRNKQKSRYQLEGHGKGLMNGRQEELKGEKRRGSDLILLQLKC